MIGNTKIVKSRQECNREIVNLLIRLVNSYPDLRFNQLLQNFDIVKPNTDQFYEESSETLNNLDTKLKKGYEYK